MYSALYFPHTQTKDVDLLKTALFLWDRLDFIVPHKDYALHSEDKYTQQALELVGKRKVPKKKDKQAAHDEIVNIARSELPQQLGFTFTDETLFYEMYPQKFLDETWDELQKTKLATALYEDGELVDMGAERHFGLYMMITLAIACGRGRRRLITDRVDSYHSLYNLLSDADASAQQAKGSSHTQILTTKFKGFNFADISLSRLVKLRKKEDSLLAELRRTFLDELDKSVAELSDHAEDESDVEEIIDGFTSKMETDMRELKRALRRNAASTLLSKEFGVAVAALALQPVEPVTSSLLSAGALSKTLMSYQDKRRDLLKNHASAWLHATARRNWLY